jgi:hypothetical protein
LAVCYSCPVSLAAPPSGPARLIHIDVVPGKGAWPVAESTQLGSRMVTPIRTACHAPRFAAQHVAARVLTKRGDHSASLSGLCGDSRVPRSRHAPTRLVERVPGWRQDGTLLASALLPRGWARGGAWHANSLRSDAVHSARKLTVTADAGPGPDLPAGEGYA